MPSALPPVVDHDTWRTAARRPAPTREGRHPRTRRHRRATPPAAHGRDAGLHADRPRRPDQAGRRLRRYARSSSSTTTCGTTTPSGSAAVHRPHLAVHAAGFPGQLRRALRDRHQRPHRGGTGLPREGRQQDGLVLVVAEFVRRRHGRTARGRVSPSTCSCATATPCTAPGTPTAAAPSSSATPSP